MLEFSGSRQGKTRRSSVTTIKYTACSTAGQDLARRAGQCGFYQHDQDSSYVDLGFFLPDAPGVDVINTSQSSRTKDVTWLEAVVVADMEPVEAAELFCADSEAPERDARYGHGRWP